jgi:hypothetical protein
MKRVEQVSDRFMGYLGLFLIGALSWAADHMAPRRHPASGANAGDVTRRAANPIVRPRISLAAHQGR